MRTETNKAVLEGGITPEVAEQLWHKRHTVKLYTEKDCYFSGVHAIPIDPYTGTLKGLDIVVILTDKIKVND
jgi:hypothetical protein